MLSKNGNEGMAFAGEPGIGCYRIGISKGQPEKNFGFCSCEACSVVENCPCLKDEPD